MLLLLAFIWGSSFILMKKGLVAFDSMQVASLRIIIAFIFLTPFLPIAIKLLKRRHYLPVLIAALIGNGMPAFLFAEAQTKLDSALVGILNSIVPLFTFFIAFFFFRIKVSKANFLGIILGFLGVLFVIQPGFESFNIYYLIVLIGVLLITITTFIVNKYNHVTSNIGYFLYGGFFVHFISIPLFLMNPLKVTLLEFILISTAALFINSAMFFATTAFKVAQKHYASVFSLVYLQVL